MNNGTARPSLLNEESTTPNGRGRRQRGGDKAKSLRRPIILVGLMGSGKTTIGRRLAERLRIPFVDSDQEIEKAAGMSVAELFARYGETYFRQGEQRVIERLLDDRPKVIATGGGAFLTESARLLMMERGLVIWLDADIGALVNRTARRRGLRPLLQDGDPGEILTGLAATRNPVYALAHIRVPNRTGEHVAAVETILHAVRRATEGECGTILRTGQV